ncbi:MAG: hypothetical protein WEA31_03330, partial [Pirellulales bacterium]
DLSLTARLDDRRLWIDGRDRPFLRRWLGPERIFRRRFAEWVDAMIAERIIAAKGIGSAATKRIGAAAAKRISPSRRLLDDFLLIPRPGKHHAAENQTR